MKHSSRTVEVNGEKVAAAEYPSDSDKYMFICHGFGGHRERQTEYIEPGLGHGFNIVTFDFRGNGESEGDFIEQDLSSKVEDLQTVVKRFDPKKAFLFGTSFGGRVVLEATDEIDPEAVVVKSPVTFNSVMEEFRNVVEEKGEFEYIDGKPIDQRFFDDLDSYSFEKTAEKIECPVAIFHGRDDTTVNPENSVRAMNCFETDVMIQILEGEKHSFSENGKQKMIRQMFSWLETI